MREETRRFARYVIEENLDIDNFLDSEFSFVNKPLARLYGMEPPQESGFHKITLANRYRGGLLGQASVLTVTANGIDTSPGFAASGSSKTFLATRPTHHRPMSSHWIPTPATQSLFVISSKSIATSRLPTTVTEKLILSASLCKISTRSAAGEATDAKPKSSPWLEVLHEMDYNNPQKRK
jgi:hypothetical protein